MPTKGLPSLLQRWWPRQYCSARIDKLGRDVDDGAGGQCKAGLTDCAAGCPRWSAVLHLPPWLAKCGGAEMIGIAVLVAAVCALVQLFLVVLGKTTQAVLGAKDADSLALQEGIAEIHAEERMQEEARQSRRVKITDFATWRRKVELDGVHREELVDEECADIDATGEETKAKLRARHQAAGVPHKLADDSTPMLLLEQAAAMQAIIGHVQRSRSVILLDVKWPCWLQSAMSVFSSIFTLDIAAILKKCWGWGAVVLNCVVPLSYIVQ
eukprot:g2211.t1